MRSCRPGACLAAFTLLLGMAGCGLDPHDWANRRQIIEAADRCGVSNFRPTRAGAGWAAYVEPPTPAAKVQEDCIYDDLARQGLRVTR
jgi:hypothetical protein